MPVNPTLFPRVIVGLFCCKGPSSLTRSNGRHGYARKADCSDTTYTEPKGPSALSHYGYEVPCIGYLRGMYIIFDNSLVGVNPPDAGRRLTSLLVTLLHRLKGPDISIHHK